MVLIGLFSHGSFGKKPELWRFRIPHSISVTISSLPCSRICCSRLPKLLGPLAQRALFLRGTFSKETSHSRLYRQLMVHTHMYINIHICIYVNTYVYIYIYKYVYIYICICIYMYMYMYIYVYIYMCIPDIFDTHNWQRIDAPHHLSQAPAHLSRPRTNCSHSRAKPSQSRSPATNEAHKRTAVTHERKLSTNPPQPLTDETQPWKKRSHERSSAAHERSSHVITPHSAGRWDAHAPSRAHFWARPEWNTAPIACGCYRSRRLRDGFFFFLSH